MAFLYLVESDDSIKPLKDMSSQSFTVKTTDMLKESFFQECLKVNFLLLRSGTTYEHLKAGNYLADPKLFMAAFPAKTFQSQDAEQAWRESEADYFSRSSGLLARYDPDSSSWRTSQLLLFEEQSELLENFASCGMTVDGEFFPLVMWERTTDGKDGGVWLGTPTAEGMGHATNVRSEAFRKGRLPNPQEFVTMWPTPVAQEGGEGKNPSSRGRKLHKLVERLPTPTINGNYNRKGASKTSGNGLATVVGGKLNPTWIEWLMECPSEWTALEDWAIAWFRPKRKKPSNV
jgi:hypothetical protein